MQMDLDFTLKLVPFVRRHRSIEHAIASVDPTEARDRQPSE